MEIKDSGVRTTYESGAVRDSKCGMGRRDLMPLDVIARLLNKKDVDCALYWIEKFKNSGDVSYLYAATQQFVRECGERGDANDYAHALLEASVQFEIGAKKYGENNWQKGIPAYSYIHSAVGHYLKLNSGWEDEPHYRAVLWNLLCCIWTCENMPELNVYATVDNGTDDISHATNVLYAENKPTMCYINGDSGKDDTKDFIKVIADNTAGAKIDSVHRVLDFGVTGDVMIRDGIWLGRDEYEYIVLPNTKKEEKPAGVGLGEIDNGGPDLAYIKVGDIVEVVNPVNDLKVGDVCVIDEIYIYRKFNNTIKISVIDGDGLGVWVKHDDIKKR